MFGKKKKIPASTYDETRKYVTWCGGIKMVPITKREQREMKAEYLKRDNKSRKLLSQGGNIMQRLVKAIVFGVLFAIIQPIVDKLFDAIFSRKSDETE